VIDSVEDRTQNPKGNYSRKQRRTAPEKLRLRYIAEGEPYAASIARLVLGRGYACHGVP
jgi:hypothetical protein